MQIKRFQLIHFFSEHLNKSFQFKRHMSHILLAWLSLGKTLNSCLLKSARILTQILWAAITTDCTKRMCQFSQVQTGITKIYQRNYEQTTKLRKICSI